MSEPRILAGFVQDTLGAVDGIDRDLGRRVREALAPATLTAIESASPLSRVPLALDVELTHCLFQEAGPERAQLVFRSNLAQSLDRPLLRPLLEGAFAIFGRSPERVLRWASKVWSSILIDSGSMRLGGHDTSSACIELESLAPEIAASRDYLLGIASSILGFFDVLGVHGEATVESSGAPHATIRLRWS